MTLKQCGIFRCDVATILDRATIFNLTESSDHLPSGHLQTRKLQPQLFHTQNFHQCNTFSTITFKTFNIDGDLVTDNPAFVSISTWDSRAVIQVVDPRPLQESDEHPVLIWFLDGPRTKSSWDLKLLNREGDFLFRWLRIVGIEESRQTCLRFWEEWRPQAYPKKCCNRKSNGSKIKRLWHQRCWKRWRRMHRRSL